MNSSDERPENITEVHQTSTQVKLPTILTLYSFCYRFPESKVLGTCIQGTLKWMLRGRRHKMLFESIIIVLEFPFRIQVWWHTAVIPALGRLTQEDLEFETWLGYIVRPYLTVYPKRICLSVAKGRSQTGDLINKLSLQYHKFIKFALVFHL